MKRKINIKKLITFTAAVLVITSSMPLFAETKNNSSSKEITNSIVLEKKLVLVKNDKIKDYNYYFYDATKDGFKSTRSDVLSPKYFIFAGNKTEDEVNNLIAELKILKNVQEWGGQVYVISPKDRKSYGNDDKEAFIDLVGPAISNVKVIGINEGATFANNHISQSCYFIAGMMVYGGEINKDTTVKDVVPVYLSNTSDNIVNAYKKVNGAIEKNKKDKFTLYSNKDKKLQTVSVAKDKKESLAEAFENAWKSVFSKNYRQHNSVAEFYMLDARRATSNYELIDSAMFDEIGITYNQEINKSITGMPDKYTWYEYVPKTIKNSKSKSMPLVISLHGNLNDPRLQGDTTGWPELAAKENFIVVAPEWQEGDNFFKIKGMGGEGVMQLIKDLEAKYPQIDPSRIYVNGLSLGGAESFLLGLKHSEVFAGVGITSGVNVFADEVTKIADNYSKGEIPLLYLCGDHDFFQMIPVDGSSKFGTKYLFGDQVWDHDKNVHIFSSLQAYEKVNGLAVSNIDMKANEYYGIALNNQHWIKLGEKDMLVGTLSNKNGVVMELAAIKDLAHWNYKPEAEYIWSFFKKYKRDTVTGKLIFN